MASTPSRAIRAFARQARNPQLWRRLAGVGVHMERESLVPRRYFLEAFPKADDLPINVGELRFTASNMDPMEVYCLMAIATLSQPERIFEFGTFDGATTLRLAMASPQAQIVTCDLPGENETSMRAAEKGESIRGVGSRFIGSPEAARITQLRLDSRALDVSPYLEAMDLVVIDGGHDYDVVRSDTELALAMLRPGGFIVWDDYSPLWPDVVRAVEEAASSGQVTDLIHIAGTEMAIGRRSL